MKQKAFTLVELLVVIAILAILGTVSIVGYTSFTTKAKLSNDEVITDHGNFKVVSIETSVKSVPVYNFHVQDNGNYLNATYFANGIVVHNASGC